VFSKPDTTTIDINTSKLEPIQQMMLLKKVPHQPPLNPPLKTLRRRRKRNQLLPMSSLPQLQFLRTHH